MAEVQGQGTVFQEETKREMSKMIQIRVQIVASRFLAVRPWSSPSPSQTLVS